MGKPWEKYQQQSQPASTEKFDPSTARPVNPFDQFDNPLPAPTDYWGGAECIAILWLPLLLLVLYFKKRKAALSGWCRIGMVISILILLIGTVFTVPDALRGAGRTSLVVSIFFSGLAAMPWVCGYTFKWIIDGFRSDGRSE